MLPRTFDFSIIAMMQIAKKVARALIQKNQTLCTAESCTGGLLANLLTDVPGSSRFFRIGIVAYANDAKTQVLHVPAKTITSYGAVSLPTIRWMAQGARVILKTDFSIAISGIAGPTGSTPTKPIGLTFIALASRKKIRSYKFCFRGSRLSIKKQAAAKALELFFKFFHEK